MANYRSAEESKALKQKILFSAAKLFLSQGYENTSVRQIAQTAGLTSSVIFYEMKNKEEILCELVKNVLESQFKATSELIKGKTDDKILFYAAETTLQLYITESNEYIRNLYAAAYSMPNSSAVIQHTITCKLEDIFKEHLPNLETKDFYELEIASGGIMRGFMTIPCDMYFTMDRKVSRFLETTFLVYRVSDEKIQETIDFVSQFDFESIAQKVIDNMLSYLESKI